MDKTAIKNFAVESRRQMIESVKYQANLIGISSDSIAEPISKAEGMETYDYGAGTHTIFDEDILKRESLVREVINKGFDNVVEEVAYTWFNRIIAIRFMEVNDYLPTRIRVLSSETEGKIEPDIITEVFNLDLDYSDDDKQLIHKLLNENELDELFKFLFIKQCNKLNEILPGLFERTDDYLELLLNISFTNEEGVVRQLIKTIPESDFENQVEIIGWLYQFYNSELKDETFADLKKGKKIPKERIPAATQLFTPDWIVKYMVENSLGRLWLENHPNDDLKSKWKYYVEDAVQDSNVELQLVEIKNQSEILKPEDIKVIDPCMGSGHILVYVFDVLMQIYISEGYMEREAAELILTYNIHGLDIDDRAYQLAYFAIMMKARQYNRTILTKGIFPLICPIQETNNLSNEFIENLKLVNHLKNKNHDGDEELDYLISKFKNAKEYGSILNINRYDFIKIDALIKELEKDNEKLTKFKYDYELKLLKLILNQAILLSQKYEITLTNPPYMGKKSLNENLKKYLDEHYKDVKTDLYSTFIKKCINLTKDNGLCSMVTIHTWMFIKSYEQLREIVLNKSTIINMIHSGAATFEELNSFNVLVTSFVLRINNINGYKSCFVRLTDYLSREEKINHFHDDENIFYRLQNIFNIIPTTPFVYWISDKIINNFENKLKVENFCDLKQGLATGDNNKFVRYWYEVKWDKIGLNFHDSSETINSNFKWFPYNKGGNFRKWYGNNEYVVNWENDGYEIKNLKNDRGKQKSRPQNTKFYFKEGITYSLFGFENFGVRYKDYGFVFDVSGSSIFVKKEYLYYILSFLASNVAFLYLSTLAPTVNFQVGNISNIPLIIDDNSIPIVNELAKRNINISKDDWDSSEVSWDFKKHPFLNYGDKSLEMISNKYQEHLNGVFDSLKDNEEELNKIFIDIYGLEGELSYEVNERDIALTRYDYENSVKSFISYAVGCMFGRYSLDEEGLQFAGGTFDRSNYHKFVPDDDNIIPVLDTEYFEDDIVGRFVDFVKVCFGEERKEENLDFIAGALKKKGKTSREIIRNYFLNDFFKDHYKMYNKIPIYWQFDSGKQNAFKCLVYMHRYESDLVARVRTDYLHKTQKAIEQNLAHCDKIIANSSNKSEISKATKDRSKYIKQLDEIKVYDEALGHIANQHIEIDLDDGVKVNYSKFQNVEISREGERTKKINLLKKI